MLLARCCGQCRAWLVSCWRGRSIAVVVRSLLLRVLCLPLRHLPSHLSPFFASRGRERRWEESKLSSGPPPPLVQSHMGDNIASRFLGLDSILTLLAMPVRAFDDLSLMRAQGNVFF
jgi:hypothetical protein